MCKFTEGVFDLSDDDDDDDEGDEDEDEDDDDDVGHALAQGGRMAQRESRTGWLVGYGHLHP